MNIQLLSGNSTYPTDLSVLTSLDHLSIEWTLLPDELIFQPRQHVCEVRHGEHIQRPCNACGLALKPILNRFNGNVMASSVMEIYAQINVEDDMFADFIEAVFSLYFSVPALDVLLNVHEFVNAVRP